MRLLDDLYMKYRETKDPAAQEKLMKAVYRFARVHAVTNSYPEPDDIAQEVVLFIWQKLPSLIETKDESFSFHRYMAAIRKYIAMDHTRKQYKGFIFREFNEDLHIRKEADERRAPISILPKNLQQAARLLELGYTQKEVANKLGITVNALKGRLKRFRKITLT